MRPYLKYTFLSVLSSVLLSIPWLGIGPGWILLIAFVPLFILEEKLRFEQPLNHYLIFNYTFLCFWLWHAITVWWVVQVTVWGMLSLSIANAAIMALIWWLFARMKAVFNNQLALIAFVSLWLSFEFLHHRWEIEWPWLCLGNGLAAENKIIQWYEYSGIAGGTLWILLSNILLFSIWKRWNAKSYSASTGQLSLWIMLVIIPVFWSLKKYSNYTENGEAIEVAILQPNIDPFTEKFSGMTPEKQLQILLTLTDSIVKPTTQYVVGPETCLPEINENSNLTINPFIKPFWERTEKFPKLKFILGAMSRKNLPSDTFSYTARFDSSSTQWYDLYNSAIQIDSSSRFQFYHKSILVAGVEKMPFQRYFRFLKSHSLDLGGTTGSLGIQNEPTVFTSNHIAAPVICFESLFGQYLGGFIKKGAQFFAVITNDGWLPRPSGYRQHLNISRIRAIESRRGIARSANTGISALINQRGDIVKKTRWNKRTAISGSIHLNQEQTFYSKYGDYIGRIALFMGSLLLLYFLSRTFIRKQ